MAVYINAIDNLVTSVVGGNLPSDIAQDLDNFSEALESLHTRVVELAAREHRRPLKSPTLRARERLRELTEDLHKTRHALHPSEEAVSQKLRAYYAVWG
jgi:hypothetical protein